MFCRPLENKFPEYCRSGTTLKLQISIFSQIGSVKSSAPFAAQSWWSTQYSCVMAFVVIWNLKGYEVIWRMSAWYPRLMLTNSVWKGTTLRLFLWNRSIYKDDFSISSSAQEEEGHDMQSVSSVCWGHSLLNLSASYFLSLNVEYTCLHRSLYSETPLFWYKTWIVEIFHISGW